MNQKDETEYPRKWENYKKFSVCLMQMLEKRREKEIKRNYLK